MQVITIAQQKGGAGKTTVAVHLAVALSQKGNRVAVIDIDPQGSFTQWHTVREERFGEGFTGLTFAAISGWRIASEISRLRRNHDYIIIDSPPHTETEARTAIRSADFVLIPVQPSPTDIWATKATYELVKKEKIPMRLLLNRVPSSSKLAGMIASDLPSCTQNCLGNRVAFASSLMEGRGVTEVDPSSLAAQEIKALVKELIKIWEKPEAAETPSDHAFSKEKETA